MIQVVIVDGQDQDRSNAEFVLSSQNDIMVAGTGKDEYDAIRLVGRYTPDILVVDADLSGKNGVKPAFPLRCRFPHTAAIILTNMDDDTNALNAIGNGVSGYLLKSKDMEQLAAVIRVVYAGGCHLSPSIAARVFPQMSRIARETSPITPPPHFLVNMSKTELRIIHHVGEGLENQEIAEKLHLKTGTIRNYVTVLLRKTSLRNRAQLAVFAEQNGLIQLFLQFAAA
ncbi:DNA-binding response regulator [Spirochaetia bacterium]|nr:DNA-binding response regulator [Spirochaetia bacterium]